MPFIKVLSKSVRGLKKYNSTVYLLLKWSVY